MCFYSSDGNDAFVSSQKQNFLRDQSGMKKQLLTLQQLIGTMDPELYRHLGRQPSPLNFFFFAVKPLSLEKADGLNLFFCFRYVFDPCVCIHVLISCSWVLIAFKREFPFDDVLCLWEVLWTDYYSNNFVLFIALAVLESHRDMILRYLVEVRGLHFYVKGL